MRKVPHPAPWESTFTLQEGVSDKIVFKFVSYIDKLPLISETIKVTYNDLATYIQNNSTGSATGYASAKLQMLTLEYELFELLPFNFCGEWVSTTSDNGNMTNYACPHDGRYTFSIDYTLPENKDKTTWFASGWTATAEIMIHSKRSESSTILADCKLEFHTSVTHNEESSEWKDLPSAATITFGLLSVALFLCMTVCFLACKKKTREGDNEYDEFQKYIDSIDDEETVETHVEVARKLAKKLRYGKPPKPDSA